MDRYVVMSCVDLGRSLGSGNTAPFDPGLLGAVESMTGLLRLLPALQTAKDAPKTKKGIQLPSIVGSGEWGKPPFKKCGSSTEVLLEQTPSIAVQKQTFPKQQQQLQQQSPQIQVCTSLAQNSTFEQAHALTLVGEGIVKISQKHRPPREHLEGGLAQGSSGRPWMTLLRKLIKVRGSRLKSFIRMKQTWRRSGSYLRSQRNKNTTMVILLVIRGKTIMTNGIRAIRWRKFERLVCPCLPLS
ncbi:hypothetical protein TB1_024886 [Malus domestica]